MRCMLIDKMRITTEDELMMSTHLFPWGLKSFLCRNNVGGCGGEREVKCMNERVGSVGSEGYERIVWRRRGSRGI